MESFIANKLGLMTATELKEVTDYLIQVFGKVNEAFEPSKILTLALQDKKNKGDMVLMAVPKTIGEAQWDVEVSAEELAGGMDYYRSL
jgi:3-dehydroquinate synthase